jgi:hypothetical protein
VLGGVVSGTFTVAHNAVDTTNNDDNGFTSMLPGNTTLTLSAELRFDPTDTAQGTLEAIAADVDNGGGSFKALKAFRVRPLIGSNESEWSFDGYVTNFEITQSNDEAVNVSFECQSSGASTGAAAAVYAPQT